MLRKPIKPIILRDRGIIKILKQTGKSDLSVDKTKTARLPGKRISRTGKIYWETRRSRSDKLGSKV